MVQGCREEDDQQQIQRSIARMVILDYARPMRHDSCIPSPMTVSTWTVQDTPKQQCWAACRFPVMKSRFKECVLATQEL